MISSILESIDEVNRVLQVQRAVLHIANHVATDIAQCGAGAAGVLWLEQGQAARPVRTRLIGRSVMDGRFYSEDSDELMRAAHCPIAAADVVDEPMCRICFCDYAIEACIRIIIRPVTCAGAEGARLRAPVLRRVLEPVPAREDHRR